MTGLNEADEAEAAALDYTFLPSPKGSGSSAGSAAGRGASVADPPAEPPPPPPLPSYQVDTPRPPPRTNRTRLVPQPASKDAPPAAPADAAAPSAVCPRRGNPIALTVCPSRTHAHHHTQSLGGAASGARHHPLIPRARSRMRRRRLTRRRLPMRSQRKRWRLLTRRPRLGPQLHQRLHPKQPPRQRPPRKPPQRAARRRRQRRPVSRSAPGSAGLRRVR